MTIRFTILAMTLLVVSGQVRSAPETIEKDIHALLDGFHAAAANAKFDDYFGRFSKRGIFMGTDASERWDVKSFKQYARAGFDAGRGWRYTVLERHLDGNDQTFWFDEILHNERLGRCRGTGVVVRENGAWKIAHYSLTLLIPNEIAADVGAQTLKIDGRPVGQPE